VEIRYYGTDEPAVNFGDAEREFCQLAHDKTSPWHYKTVGDYNESSYNEAQAVYIALMMAHEVGHHGGGDDLLQDSFFHEDYFDKVFDMLGHHYTSVMPSIRSRAVADSYSTVTLLSTMNGQNLVMVLCAPFNQLAAQTSRKMSMILLSTTPALWVELSML